MWQWRVSDKPRFCDLVCIPDCEDKKIATPCGGCDNAPPALHLANYLPNEIYESGFSCRDGYGGLSWAVILKIVDARGLDADTSVEIIKLLSRVESAVQEEYRNQQKIKDKKNTAKNKRGKR